jgi:DNA recombination protein RmuC
MEINMGLEMSLQYAPYLLLLILGLLAIHALRGTAKATAHLREELIKVNTLRTEIKVLEADQTDHRVRQAEASTRAEGLQKNCAELRDEIVHLKRDLGDSSAARQSAELRIENLETAKSRDATAHAAQVAQLSTMREDIDKRFQLLAQEVVDKSGAALAKNSDERLGALLGPLKEQITRFEVELRGVHDGASKDRERLKTEILTLTMRSEAISKQADGLTRALKGDKQKQGAWGEMILTTLLERSGLREGEEYETQAHRIADGGDRLRPDVIVRLPGNRTLVIDSKVSLISYEAGVNADSPEDQASAVKLHVAAVRRHIDLLSTKDYHQHEGNSVDYVVMFLPIEGALAVALRSEPDLTSYALDRNVTIATPTTLMMALRTIESVWAIERRNNNADAIAKRAGFIYSKMSGVVASMVKVTAAIDRASDEQRKAMGQLSDGNGNLLSQFDTLKRLGAKTNKSFNVSYIGATESESDGIDEIEA